MKEHQCACLILFSSSMDESQRQSATRRGAAARAVVLAGAMLALVAVAAVLLSSDARPNLLESSADLVSASRVVPGRIGACWRELAPADGWPISRPFVSCVRVCSCVC